MKDFPLVYIIIVNWNRRKLLKECLHSIKLYTRYPNFGVVVVDNGSTDGSLEFVRRNYPWMDIIQNRVNMGFAKANNQGIKLALERGADYVFLLNNDTKVIDGDWLTKLIEVFEADPSIGIMGGKLVYPNGTIQHAGGIITVEGISCYGLGEPDDGTYDQMKDVDYITGAAFMIKREVVDKIGLFDEEFSPVYCEETDYCVRARMAGYRMVYNPATTIVHYHRGTIKALVTNMQMNYWGRKNMIRFMLINFPVTWLFKRMTVEPKIFLGFLFEKKDESRKLSPSNARLRKNWSSWLLLYLKAYWENLKMLGDITRKRMSRTQKIWYAF